MALFCYTAPRRSPLAAVLMVPSPIAFKHGVTERFLRYVVIDTQSDPASPTCPSTEKQKDLGRLLAAELQAMGLADAHLDEHGYVYATIPANTAEEGPGDLLLLAHGHVAGLHRQERQAADREELPRRRHRAAGRSHPGDPRRRASRARRADRPRHHHDRRHHAAGRRQQGRPCRDHGCRAVPDSTIPRSGTAPSRSCSRRTKRSAAASTRST